MPSFDVVCKPDLVEVRNAVDQANREISTRFDFKGSDSRIEEKVQSGVTELIVHADDDFKLGQVTDILLAKLAKRSVDVRLLDRSAAVEKAGVDKRRQTLKVKAGLEQTLAKRIVQLVREGGGKLTGSIQGDAVRVSGAKKDALQACMAALRTQVTEVPVTFENFRD
jgi:uncharacterized protein YajQ (UPF0234 family)